MRKRRPSVDLATDGAANFEALVESRFEGLARRMDHHHRTQMEAIRSLVHVLHLNEVEVEEEPCRG